LVDLNDILKDVALVAKGECRKRSIKMTVKHAEVPQVYIDTNSVSQAILNIVLNGIQAIDKDGQISVGVSSAKFINKDHEEKRGVCVSISDSGKGIPQDELYKIFDPFYTTKYQSTGLGLSLVLRIVNKHGGKVDVESEVDKGTTFHLYFPVK
jgi:signal transduction histidine kinase